MSLFPVEPYLDRHCFAPCRVGKFCACLGRYITCGSNEHKFEFTGNFGKFKFFECIICGDTKAEPL